MSLRSVVRAVAALALAGSTACAAGMGGGGKPMSYRALALSVPVGASADSVASIVRQAMGDLVLIVSPADSAWFTQVARGTSLHLSGPTGPAPVRMGFLAAKPVGDTTLTLNVSGGRPLLVHDALYQPSKNRHVDLMLVRIDTGTSAAAAAHSLLTYVATDVMQNAAVVLGLVAPSPAIADSVAARIRPIFVDVRDCAPPQGANTTASTGATTPANPALAAAAAPVHVLYGPETLVRCEEARVLPGVGTPVFTRFTVGYKQ